MPDAFDDPVLIAQAFTNLISNAFKYSSKTGAPQIGIGWSSTHAAWFVRDNGTGFDMVPAGNLVGTFQRLHTQSEFPGTDVGLSIVKRIVQRHQGQVWAESAPGDGATFYVRLPDTTAAKAEAKVG